MSEADSIEFYRRSVVGFARSLPIPQAVLFLRGALAVAGHHPEMADVRSAFAALVSGDDQLELIAGPQRRLDLGGDGA